MQRIMVMGGPGSGKSTVARSIGDKLSLPVHHLDAHFWLPGWRQRPEDDFAARVRDIAKHDRWVIDGNYSRILPDRLERADVVVYLDLPLWIRLPRVIRRRFAYRGRAREDMGKGCPERIDWVFFKFVVFHSRERRPRMLALLDQLREEGMPVALLQSRREVDAFLARLKQGDNPGVSPEWR